MIARPLRLAKLCVRRLLRRCQCREPLPQAPHQIAAARKVKPVVASVNSLAASAGYWLAAQAGEVYVTPGGEAGSIGVWMAHEDWSAAMAEQGVKVTLISSGKHKVEGNPYEPLSEEARTFLQGRTDEYYAAFTKAVAKGRGVPIDAVRSGMGQGRVLGAEGFPFVTIQHPISSATNDALVERGRKAAREAAQIIVG